MNKDSIKLRNANTSDAIPLLEWRNDPITRKWSMNDDEVKYEGHIKWLDRVLSNPEKIELYIAEHEGNMVGTIRFELLPTNAGEMWFVSITVSPGKRRKGYGRLILQAGCLIKKYDQLAAIIKSGNKASIKIFEEAGFIECEVFDSTLLFLRAPLLL